jgi:Cu(I)/Ag(I) efflux system membrane protein CusA/SilA
MIRDEAGMLVGYVYVDITDDRDIGSYVEEARAAVARATEAGELRLPTGSYLRWTGQYELLADMETRMKVLIPVALLIVVVLLFFQFKNFTEVLIVLLSVPFALVGSVWALWLLGYNLSTAVWVGVIALVGLAAQTGVVMIVYIDHAYERRREAGQINSLEDIIHAHSEGTIQRVRPKLMTVGTMMIGLTPLLWADGSGADVMRRIAAPMVGGLVTSAFLTLEIIPVIYTYWRYEQLLWQWAGELAPAHLPPLRWLERAVAVGFAVAAAAVVAPIYLEHPPAALPWIAVAAATLALAAAVAYVGLRFRMKHAIARARAAEATA